MNRFPLWKNLVIVAALVVGIIYGLPNLFAPDPAIQISASSRAATIDQKLLAIATEALDNAGIDYFGESLSESSALVRLRSLDAQLPAQRAIAEAVNQAYAGHDTRYVVALNMASNTPQWLQSLGATPMNLGLDLAGGVHFLLEVDTPKALQGRIEDMEQALKKGIRDQRLFNVTVSQQDRTLTLTAQTDEHRAALLKLIEENLPEASRDSGGNSDGSFWVTAALSEQTVKQIEDHAVSQNLTTIRKRVNELGVSEPLVQKQGRNRIVVELPGVQDTARAKDILGKTANLEFRLEADSSTLPAQKERFEFYDPVEREQRGPKFLERQRIVTGENVVNAVAGFDQQSNGPKIDITLDSAGGVKMGRVTKDEVGRNMGVLFIDTYTVKEFETVNGETVEREVTRQDSKIINLATIRGVFGSRFQITGLGSSKEANDVALLLRAGSLAAPMKFVEERTIGPSLGAKNIAQGVASVKLGLFLVVVIMLGYYKVFGIAANLALTMNMILLVALMSMLGATLTLPGIAGIVLTVGMAVDANVLIFSRIKEELKAGLPPQRAISAGFDRAFTAIFDANITTLITAFILFAVATGPVKGFAVTLSLGIMTSMFTAIWGTRALINLMYGGRKVTKLWI